MVYQAEELIKREMVTMIRSDIVNHPTAQQIENLTHKKSKNAAHAVIAATRAALESEPLESFTEKEIAHARELLANEMEFVRSKMAHGDLPIESYTKVWEECYAQVSVFWSKGILSKAVFDRRTSNGSGLFASLGGGFGQIFGKIFSIRVKILCKTYSKGKGLTSG